MRDRDEVMAWLRDQKAVDFLSPLRDGESVMLLTRDAELATALQKRGAWVRWYDRTIYSTQAGAEPNWQADITLGPRFWQQDVAA